MKIDIQKANAAIDDYIANLRDPKKFPMSISSLYWAKACLERNGVIPDARKLDLNDHCVLWVACIVVCKRVREVSRIEIERRACRKGRSLERTVRAWKSGKRSGFEMLKRRLDQHIEDTLGKERGDGMNISEQMRLVLLDSVKYAMSRNHNCCKSDEEGYEVDLNDAKVFLEELNEPTHA